MRIYGIPIYRNHYVSNNVKHENIACLLPSFLRDAGRFAGECKNEVGYCLFSRCTFAFILFGNLCMRCPDWVGIVHPA